MKQPNNCKCGSDIVFRCKDTTERPYRYWCKCLSCGYVGGVVTSNLRYASRLVFRDGTEDLRSPEEDSVDLWNQEVSDND